MDFGVSETGNLHFFYYLTFWIKRFFKALKELNLNNRGRQPTEDGNY